MTKKRRKNPNPFFFINVVVDVGTFADPKNVIMKIFGNVEFNDSSLSKLNHSGLPLSSRIF